MLSRKHDFSSFKLQVLAIFVLDDAFVSISTCSQGRLPVFELFYAVIWYLVWDREILGNHIIGTLSDAPRVFEFSRPSP